MKYVIFGFLLLACLGCVSTDPMMGRLDGMWGPGVSNPDVIRDKMIELNKNEKAWRLGWGEYYMKGMFLTMTWDQAAYVYRTTPELRVLMKNSLIGDYDKLRGKTREEIIAVLGAPDDADDDGAIYYTGEGSASDSTSGYGMTFGPDGIISGIVPAN